MTMPTQSEIEAQERELAETVASLERSALRVKRERDELLALVRVALPYVEKVAATAPTEMNRQQRQRQASKDARAIRDAIASVGT